MRTIATLNLPASTSGIWTLAPPWAAPGDVVHAVTTSKPANRVLANLNRRLTIDLLLLDAGPRCARRASSRDWAGTVLRGVPPMLDRERIDAPTAVRAAPEQARSPRTGRFDRRGYSSAGAESSPWSSIWT